MDLYGGVGSPSLTFLGSSSLLSLGGSFISSSPKRRHTSKITTTLDNHLLSDNQQPQERHSSDHSLHTQWKSSVKVSSQHEKSPHVGQSSFGQAVVNGMYITFFKK